MNIVFLDAKTLGEVPNLDQLSALGNLKVFTSTQPQDVEKRLKNAEIAITNKVPVTSKTMAKCPNLKLICVAATGMNNIDLDAAKQHGIQVKNVVGYSTQSVAQVTFSLLLGLLNHMAYFDKYIKDGEYAHSDIFTHLGPGFWELNGKKLGIIGLGNIGKKVAEIATAFGCQVAYHSVSGNKQEVPYPMVGLEELLASSDVVSIHCPLTEQTRHLLNYERLSQMQSHALLINTSRGEVVSEVDLVRALDEDLIGGAGLDVFAREPLPADSPLLTVNNPEKLLLAPHIAWTSVEARIALVDGICNNIKQYASARD